MDFSLNGALSISSNINHTTSGDFYVTNQYDNVILQAPNSVWAFANNGLRVVNSNNNAWVNVYAGGFVNNSLESSKTNITEFSNALDIINRSQVYSYNYKSKLDSGEGDKLHYGFVIGDSYSLADEVIDIGGNGIDLYSMSGVMWKGIQELYNKITALEAVIASLRTQS